MLDALRAARTLTDVQLGVNTVVWGHSQGGHAALWTGAVAGELCPRHPAFGRRGHRPRCRPRGHHRRQSARRSSARPLCRGRLFALLPDLPFETAVRPGARTATRDIAALCTVLPPEDTARIFALAATIPSGVLALDAPRSPPDWPKMRRPGRSRSRYSLRKAMTTSSFPCRHRSMGGRPLRRRTTDGNIDLCGTGSRRIVLPGSPLEEPLLLWTASRLGGDAPPEGCTADARLTRHDATSRLTARASRHCRAATPEPAHVLSPSPRPLELGHGDAAEPRPDGLHAHQSRGNGDWSRVAAFYAARARGSKDGGGAALIVTGGMAPNREGGVFPGAAGLFTAQDIANHRTVTQPSTPKAAASPCRSCTPAAMPIPRCVAPSAIKSPISPFPPRELDDAGIEKQIADIATAAARRPRGRL